MKRKKSVRSQPDLAALVPPSNSRRAKDGTLDEIKAEAISRVENGVYPLIGLDPTDVRGALSHTQKIVGNREYLLGSVSRSSQSLKAQIRRKTWAKFFPSFPS
jgi:hypothetical protein